MLSSKYDNYSKKEEKPKQNSYPIHKLVTTCTSDLACMVLSIEHDYTFRSAVGICFQTLYRDFSKLLEFLQAPASVKRNSLQVLKYIYV